MTAEPRSIEIQRKPPPGTLTYEEFLDWCDEDTLAEWVDGEVILTSPASLLHQRLVRFLIRLLADLAEFDDAGEVLQAPFQMRLRTQRSGREPDILFVAREHVERLRPTYLDGPADLVIEIISPESVARDRGEKFTEYEQAGIPEFWLLDPDHQAAEFYLLGADRRYSLVNPDPNGVYQSRVLPRLRLRVEWLWQEPLPVKTVLRELGLI